MSTTPNSRHAVFSVRAPRCAFHRQRGVALIIVLSFVVLLTFVVVAFFSRAIINRQVENSASARARADMLARSASEAIIADLRKEMALSSNGSGALPYLTLTPSGSQSMLPTRVLLPSVTASDSAYVNLVKQSGGSVVGSGNTGGVVLATDRPSSESSSDGRFISGLRWSAPKLIGDSSGTRNFSDQQAPNWVLMSRGGLVDPSNVAFGSSATAISNSAMTNLNFVTGRFAYNVYDEGGLLDVNVAGYAGTTGSADNAFGGILGLVSVGDAIPGMTGPDWAKFIDKWRNLATGKVTEDYLAYLGISRTVPGLADLTTNQFFNQGAKYGFLRPAVSTAGSSDNRLLGRQDLIRLATNGALGISTTALPYLTHFSREVNSPSWAPSTPSGSSIDYKGQMDAATSANRFLPKVVVKAAWTIPRADGTKPQVGEPLIKSRFPLSRIAGLGPSGIVAGKTTPIDGVLSDATAATIQRDFGLQWKTDVDPDTGQRYNCWFYVGHSGTTLQADIKKLDQVASENREPNFFELLKAGILSGSLGVDGGGGWNPSNNSNPYDPTHPEKANLPALHEQDKDLQILQIGANLIDQFDTDSYPTVIRVDRSAGGVTAQWEAVGIEHLPYPSQYKPVAGKSNIDSTKVATYFLVNLWNPHRATPAPPAAGRPDIRVSIEGTLKVLIAKTDFSTGADGDYSPDAKNPRLDIPVSAVQLTTDARDNNYLNPRILTAADAVGLAGSSDVMKWVPAPTELGVSYAAFRISDYDPVFSWPPRTDSPYNRRSAVTLAVNYSSDLFKRFQVKLEYKDPSGIWHTYSYAHGINDKTTWRGGFESHVVNGKPNTTTTPYSPRAFDANSLNSTESPGHQMVAIDPRTRHFSWIHIGVNDRGLAPFYTGLFTSSLWPTTETNGYGDSAQKNIRLAPWLIWSSGSSTYPALLSRNNNSTASQYKDADNVPRYGDSGYFTGAATSGNPFSVDADRPVVLNRPFRSVAEMGYASRDMPFRSLDFFTDKSPDAALLDLFSVNEAPGVRAGVVNLNTRQARVLQAVLAGTLKDIATSGTNLSSTDATTVASALASSAATNPLTNPAQLAERMVTIIPSTSTSIFDQRKVERETIARALGGVEQTRTWNLLIDVVAQTGRYPTSASNASNPLAAFIVEGERRYWVHVAIDRFTGQVVDSQFEPVQE